MTKSQIAALLTTLPMGQNRPVFGQSVMRTPKGFKIGANPNLFTLEDALTKMEESAAQQPAKVITPCYPRNLQALTIKAGFAWMILEGYSNDEARSYRTVPGWKVVHTSASDDTGIFKQYKVSDANKLPLKSIVGAMHVYACEWDNDYDCYVWLIDATVKIKPHNGIGGEIKPWIPRENKPDFQMKVWAFNAVWEAIQKEHPEMVVK